MGSNVAETIVFDIVDELTDQSALRQAWYNLNNDIKQEITGKLIGIVDQNLEREASLRDTLNSELDVA